MCLFLPVGYALLTTDLCFDLPWVLQPSQTTANTLRQYYTFILTPSLYSPGYWLPLFAIYVFLGLCPSVLNWILFWLFVPIACRYYYILGHPTDPNYRWQLRHWWTIIVIRMVLYCVTYYNLKQRNCKWSDYGTHAIQLYQRIMEEGPQDTNDKEF